MLLFFAGSSLVNQKEFDSKVDKIENPSGTQGSIMQDLQSADSLAAPGTSAVAPRTSEPVNLSFMEKLVYLKTDIPLTWGYILLIAGIIITITFPIVYIIKHPANLLRTLLVLAGIAVLVFLAFLAASGSPIEIPGYTGTSNSDQSVLKVIDTGLIFSYFMLGLALLSILYAEVSKYFR